MRFMLTFALAAQESGAGGPACAPRMTHSSKRAKRGLPVGQRRIKFG